MKRLLSVFVIAGLLGCLVSCKGPSQKITTAEKTSFDAVTSRLDGGGSLYMYLSAEKATQAVQDLSGKLRGMIESQVSIPQAEKEGILGVFDFVLGLVKRSGLTEISGIGMSSAVSRQA